MSLAVVPLQYVLYFIFLLTTQIFRYYFKLLTTAVTVTAAESTEGT